MHIETRGHTICAIIVSHYPNLQNLDELIEIARPQVSHVLVVDNRSNLEILNDIKILAQRKHISVLALGENSGVAAAQNLGIKWAREHGCSHVILFDQDSIPTPTMVQKLLIALDDMQAKKIPVAATGPRLIDRRTGASTSFVRIGLLGVRRQAYREGDSDWIETDFLVSSGMMIPLEIFDQVGPLEDDLFIDNVDMEWCFRARSKGLSTYGVYNAVMEHCLGDHVIQFGRYVIHLHQPLRQYYIMRNRIALYKRSYSPWGWIVQDFIRMLFKLVVFSVFIPPRRKNIAMMLKGIKDGLTGKMGKFR